MCPRQHVRHEVVKVAEGWHWIVYGISQRVVDKSPCCEKPENKTYRIKPISLSVLLAVLKGLFHVIDFKMLKKIYKIGSQQGTRLVFKFVKGTDYFIVQKMYLGQRKLALTARNTLLRYKFIEATKKFKKWPRPLFRPITNYTCHKKAKSIS
jgi:hypothetical protein